MMLEIVQAGKVDPERRVRESDQPALQDSKDST